MVRIFIIVLLTFMENVYAFSCTEAAMIPEDTDREFRTDLLDIYMEKHKDVECSELYNVYLNDEKDNEITVFKSSCNKYYKGMKGERKNDDKPLIKFKDRSIHWGHFSFNKHVKVTVKVNKNISSETIKVFPSRFNIKVSKIDDYSFSFDLERHGQYSVEIGDDGYKEGLLIFADPMETDKPSVEDSDWKVIKEGNISLLHNIEPNVTSIYFANGVHDMGVYKIPHHVKNIYIEGGAIVYGAFIIDGKQCSDVKIYGRGVLSGKKLHLRESHMVEAKNGANNIIVDGITICDYSFFAVRLLGSNNKIYWTKIVGGWIYNCDGIAAYANSHIKNCFIWANDDNIKIYRDNILVEDIVCWQLDNGAIFQLNWSNSVAHNCIVRNVDIVRAEWDSDRANNGILSCRNSGGIDKNFLFENIYTDTPVSHIFRLSPLGGKEQVIENFVFRNWNILIDNSKGKSNYLEGATDKTPIKGLVFDSLKVNGEVLNEKNFSELIMFSISKCEKIEFR